MSTSNDFKGDSKADQSNSLSGDISVNVLRVMANGNLVIRAEDGRIVWQTGTGGH